MNLYVNVDDGKGGNLTAPLVLNVNTSPLDTYRLAETIYLTRIISFTYYLRDTFYDPNNDTITYDLVNAPDWISVIGDEMQA